MKNRYKTYLPRLESINNIELIDQQRQTGVFSPQNLSVVNEICRKGMIIGIIPEECRQ